MAGKGKEFESSKGLTEVKQNKNGSLSIYIDPQKYSQLGLKPKNLPNGITLDTSEARMFSVPPFDATFFDARLEKFDNNSNSVYDDIKDAIRYFYTDPLVGKTIELMVTLSNDGFRNDCPDQEVKEWFDDWGRQIHLDQIMSWIFMEYYRSANVVIARQLIDYMPADKRKTTKRGQIPGNYTVLNPLSVDVSGSSYFGSEKLWLKVDDHGKMEEILKNPDIKALEELFNMRGSKGQKDRLLLNPENVKRILRMAQPYELMARPMIKRALKDLFLKQKLKQMDLSTINGVINQIIKVTIGDENHIATANKLRKLAQIFRNPSKTMTLVWDHTLNIEVVRPGDPKWLTKDKFDSVNDNIRSAFGISDALTGTGGSTSSGSNQYLSIKGFVGNLIEARKAVSRWLYDEYRFIGQELGFKTIPIPSFNPLSLADEIREKQIIAALVDKGVISYRTAQEYLGYDPDTELARKKEEKPLIDAGYYKQPGVTGGGQPNGRPAGQGGDYPPDRKPSNQKRLKGKAEIIEDSEDVMYSISGKELNEMGINNSEKFFNFIQKKVEEKIKEEQNLI